MKKFITLPFFFVLFSISINGDEQYIEQYNIIPLFKSPLQYKLYVDNMVMTQNMDPLIDILISENKEHQELRKTYPFAMKLYRILDNKTTSEDFTVESGYIPLEILTNTIRRLAIEGDNDLFLENMPQQLNQ